MHPSSLHSGNDRTRLPSSLLGSHTDPLMGGRSWLPRAAAGRHAEAEWTSWFSNGGGGSLQKVKLLNVSEQGKSEEWLLFSSGKTWSTTSQSLTYLEGHAQGRRPQGTPAQGSTCHAPHAELRNQKTHGQRPEPGLTLRRVL